MKIKNVPSRWIYGEGLRLDSGPYMSGSIEAKKKLEELSVHKDFLQDVTEEELNGIYHAGRVKRVWVDSPQQGYPFLSSRDILQSDLSRLRFISSIAVDDNPKLIIHKGYTLITRSGTVGRMAYARADMDGMACTEDVLRVVPDEKKILSGYLYAYLSSRFGVPLVTSGTYGAIIQHIEPHHIAELPIPRFSEEIEKETHSLIVKASMLREKYQSLITRASHILLSECGVQDIDSSQWNALGVETGFSSVIPTALTLRAFNYSPRVRSFLDVFSDREHLSLGDICMDGLLNTGKRFKRIDCDPKHGVRLIGQKQGFWLRPEGRWISPEFAPSDIFAKAETVLVASSGTLGESEVYCRPIFVFGKWTEYVYTQHFLRIIPGEASPISGAYLFAFLRTNIVFRILRSMSTGSKQQEVHRALVAKLPIPLIPKQQTKAVESDIRQAFSCRDEADGLEDQAIALVEKAIEAAV